MGIFLEGFNSVVVLQLPNSLFRMKLGFQMDNKMYKKYPLKTARRKKMNLLLLP